MIIRTLSVILTCLSLNLFAQQTGSISGKVTTDNGEGLPGVTISAVGDTLPQPRVAVTRANGNYRLLQLPPGNYELTFTMSDFATEKRKTAVRLDQVTRLDVILKVSASETLVVQASVPTVDPSSAEMKSTIENEVFDKIPVGQDYRDLQRLIPGVQVTEFNTRGPSSGGSGQDNVYKIDGVDVTLPLFGTLAAEPSSHDIDQVSVVRGGAQAINFNRSGGFLINTLSKSGTNDFQGNIEYIVQPDGWVTDPDQPPLSITSEVDRTWASVNYGGPLVKERLFFFASYYAPTTTLSERVNPYGTHPDGKQERDEIFAKLTFSPTERLTLHASHRDSTEDFEAASVGNLEDQGLTRTEGSDLTLTVFEGDYILNENHSFNVRFTSNELDTDGTPDTLLNATPSTELGSTIDITNLASQGTVFLPTFGSDETRNALIAPYIEQYGIPSDGGFIGGGTVGASTRFDNNDFKRTAFQLGWNWFIPTDNMEHDIHVGFRHTEDEEDLNRTQQGFGSIIFLSTADELIRAEFLRPEGTDPIHSEYHSDSIEINDNITMGKWNFNLGVLLSHDTLYGQDLTEDPSTPSGFRVSIGSQYEMYDIPYEDMIQPRLGIVRTLRDEQETVYANYAVYNPAATSLPRAASWARNRRSLLVRNYYNSEGVLVRTQNRGSSSGKFFQPNMNPRQIHEYLVGYSRQMDSGWTFKLSSRYRWAHNFWEDTNNNARTRFAVTSPNGDQAEIEARGDYIPDLNRYRFGDEGQDNGVGGSSYVIAELDGAFTKYYEAVIDAEKKGDNYYMKGTYTWSHYYGNFDQDNASANNDQNLFIGSSFIADGVGRQLWDFKYGNLKGDRRHILKLYGSYDVSWGGSVGAFAVYQSGEAWETSDVEFYREYTGSSSSTNRFSEPAGSRTGPDHYQLDLNYNHVFDWEKVRLSVDLDIFNIFDRQTDFNIDSVASSPTYGVGRNFFAPRRFRLGAKLSF